MWSKADVTQLKDIHGLLQASEELVLALGETLCAFHSRSSEVLRQLWAVEAKFKRLWGTKCLEKVPPDLHQSSVALGHPSQRQLGLLPSQVLYLQLCILRLWLQGPSTNCSQDMFKILFPSPCFKPVLTRWVSTTVLFVPAGDWGAACGKPTRSSNKLFPAVPGKHSPISHCTGLSVLKLFHNQNDHLRNCPHTRSLQPH